MDIRQAENRVFPRLNFRSQLRYQIRGTPSFEEGVTNDISANGIRFTSSRFIPTASPLMLEINLFNRILRPIGRVAWSSALARCERSQFGCEFIEFDPAEKSYLREFLGMKMTAV